MRAEAESTVSVVPRDVSYTVHRILAVPDDAFQRDVAVIFAHGTRRTGDTWAVGARTRSDGDLVGEIRTVGGGQEHAANAALKWIREHCASNGFEVLRVENLNDQYSEDQRPHAALIRFLITRPSAPEVSEWGLPKSPQPGSGNSHEAAQRSPWPRSDSPGHRRAT